MSSGGKCHNKLILRIHKKKKKKKKRKRNEKEKSLDSSLGAKVLCSKDLDLYQKLGKGKKIDLAESC